MPASAEHPNSDASARVRVAIIDDDINARALIEKHLEWFFEEEIDVVGSVGSVKLGIAVVQEHKPQLLFLDIDMGKGSGFMVLDNFASERERGELHVIFISSFPQFAIQAIRYDAKDFITKPVVEQEFRASVNRIIGKIRRHEVDAPEQALSKQVPTGQASSEVVIQQTLTTPVATPALPATHHETTNAAISQHTKQPASYTIVPQEKPLVESITIEQQKESRLLRCQDIEYVAADRSYSNFHIIDEKEIVTASRPMGYFRDILYQAGFVQISQSSIINPQHVYSVLFANDKRATRVKMRSGVELRLTPEFHRGAQEKLHIKTNLSKA